MSNVGILTMKDFNRIRKIVDKRKNNAPSNDTNNETIRSNSKSQLSQTLKDKKEFAHTAKALYSTDSKHLPSRIPTLSPSSKSSLSPNKKSKYSNIKEKSQIVLNSENKANKKNLRILPPSLIHDRNKNNKTSKIPLRKIQTFEEDTKREDETKKSVKSNKNSIEKVDEYNNGKLENENNQADSDNLSNSNEENDEFNETISEFQKQKNVLNQIEQLNTIPFNKDNSMFINDNYDNDSSASGYRNNILSLQMKIDSLRERRKKELAILHEKTLNQKQNFDQTSRDLINNDEEIIKALQNELLRNEADSTF